MELMHGKIVIIGILALGVILLCLFLLGRIKKKSKFTSGTRAANTARIRQSSLYRSLSIRYKVLTILVIAGLSGSVIGSLFLAARPHKTAEITNDVKKRDIIMCMDVSFSLYDLNLEITDYLKEMVKGLEGDRIGISIFNSSSVTYVPLTDDYDYIEDRLDELHDYFVMQKEYMEDFDSGSNVPAGKEDRLDELEDRILYFDYGTRYNNNRGSSFIGEGLATALYTFPNLEDQERTRDIIFSTDNQLNCVGEQVIDLNGAAEYCKKYDVTVYGVFPSEEMFFKPGGFDYDTCFSEFKAAAQKTGGDSYVRTDEQSVSQIIKGIQKREAKLVNTVTTRQVVDFPQVPFIMMIICLAIFSLTGVVLQK